jgi:hypothetical protein
MHNKKSGNHNDCTNPYQTRFTVSHKINIPVIKKSIGARHGRFIGPHIINNIPQNIINIKLEKHFKIEIKNWLMADVGRELCNKIVNGMD